MSDRIVRADQECGNCYFSTLRWFATDKENAWLTCDYNPPVPLRPDEGSFTDWEILEEVRFFRLNIRDFDWCGRWAPSEQFLAEIEKEENNV
jgi:hypothetical protein